MLILSSKYLPLVPHVLNELAKLLAIFHRIGASPAPLVGAEVVVSPGAFPSLLAKKKVPTRRPIQSPKTPVTVQDFFML